MPFLYDRLNAPSIDKIGNEERLELWILILREMFLDKEFCKHDYIDLSNIYVVYMKDEPTNIEYREQGKKTGWLYAGAQKLIHDEKIISNELIDMKVLHAGLIGLELLCKQIEYRLTSQTAYTIKKDKIEKNLICDDSIREKLANLIFEMTLLERPRLDKTLIEREILNLLGVYKREIKISYKNYRTGDEILGIPREPLGFEYKDFNKDGFLEILYRAGSILTVGSQTMVLCSDVQIPLSVYDRNISVMALPLDDKSRWIFISPNNISDNTDCLAISIIPEGINVICFHDGKEVKKSYCVKNSENGTIQVEEVFESKNTNRIDFKGKFIVSKGIIDKTVPIKEIIKKILIKVLGDIPILPEKIVFALMHELYDKKEVITETFQEIFVGEKQPQLLLIPQDAAKLFWSKRVEADWEKGISLFMEIDEQGTLITNGIKDDDEFMELCLKNMSFKFSFNDRSVRKADDIKQFIVELANRALSVQDIKHIFISSADNSECKAVVKELYNNFTDSKFVVFGDAVECCTYGAWVYGAFDLSRTFLKNYVYGILAEDIFGRVFFDEITENTDIIFENGNFDRRLPVYRKKKSVSIFTLENNNQDIMRVGYFDFNFERANVVKINSIKYKNNIPVSAECVLAIESNDIIQEEISIVIKDEKHTFLKWS